MTGSQIELWSPVLSIHSNLRLFRKFQGILDLYAKVPHGAFQLGMTQQQLDRPDVFGAPVNQGRFRTANSVSAIGGWIKTYLFNPGIG